jgi:outer membrane protein insertion porin family
VYSAYVSEVNVKGNINVKKKEIEREIRMRKGDLYSEENLREDISNILNLGYFDDASVELDTATYRITFIVKEKPFIKEVEFKGNKKFSDGKLKGKIDLRKKQYFDELTIEDNRNELIEFYKNKGYAYVKIEYDIMIDEMTNCVSITFFVNEGRKVVVGEVEIEGVKAFDRKKILSLIKTKPKKIYNEEAFRNGMEETERFYKNNGFEDVRISSPSISYNEEGNLMYIKIEIDEGAKYKVGSIEFDGNTIYSTLELGKAVAIKRGKFYNENKLDVSLQALSELYAEKGYIRAQIAPEFKKYTESGVMDVKFNIKENNLVYIDRIYVDGTTYTKDYVIRREIVLEEGEPLIASGVRRSLQKIYNLGFLDDVNVDIQGTDNPDRIDLLFTITEGRPGMISAGLAYGTVDGLVGTLQVSHMNLFGRGQKLNLLWEKGARKENTQISWTEPWFLGKPMSFGFSVYDLIRKQSHLAVSDAYNEHRQGCDLRVGPRLTDFLSLLFTYSYEVVQVIDVSEEVDSSLFSTDPELTSSLIGKVIYDTRDNIFDATRGNRNSLSIQLAGGPFGGDVHFYKPIVQTSWFFPTVGKLTFSANANVGFVDVLEMDGQKKEVPLYEKFFVGGPGTLRGYQYRRLGPDEGGSTMMVCNLELKFPIAQEAGRSVLQGAIFFDFGGAWGSFEDIKFEIGATERWRTGEIIDGETVYWDNLMKSCWGWGIRIGTPVFPIRLDWGYPLQRGRHTNQFEFWLTIGQVF